MLRSLILSPLLIEGFSMRRVKVIVAYRPSEYAKSNLGSSAAVKVIIVASRAKIARNDFMDILLSSSGSCCSAKEIAHWSSNCSHLRRESNEGSSEKRLSLTPRCEIIAKFAPCWCRTGKRLQQEPLS